MAQWGRVERHRLHLGRSWLQMRYVHHDVLLRGFIPKSEKNSARQDGVNHTLQTISDDNNVSDKYPTPRKTLLEGTYDASKLEKSA